MSKWRVVGPWMTEDEAWNELADLEMAGIHYNLGELAERVWAVAERIDADPEEIERDIGEAVKAVRAEYADYAKQEIRFCSYCGAALGIRE